MRSGKCKKKKKKKTDRVACANRLDNRNGTKQRDPKLLVGEDVFVKGLMSITTW
jgi:hypothetical protein